jgi:hypothetical protein
MVALTDRYNRGGGRLENLDRYLTQLGDRIGNYWLDRTGIDRGTLTQGLYLLAAWSAVQYASLTRNPTMLVVAAVALMAAVGKLPVSRGGLVEEIQVEALGLPRRTFVSLRLVVLSLGLLNLAMATGELAFALQTGSPPVGAGEMLLSGCALTALQAGDYIRRTNPATPSGGHHMRV